MMASESASVSTVSNSGSLSSWLSLLYVSGWPFISTSSDTRCPTTRPVLPRTSSGTSGFFFCGMIELPVQKRSANCTKPKRGLDQSTSSSHSRDRWTITSAAAASNSIAKSRSDTASSELGHSPSKPSSFATCSRVDRKGCAGQRGGAERQAIDAPAAVGQPLAVARKHRVVRHQVVAERDRLRDLHVRESRHDRRRMAFGQVDERAAQRRELRRKPVDLARGATAADRSRPGRCASGRYAAACRRRRPGR